MGLIVISRRVIHLSLGWEVAVISAFVIVMLALLTVIVCQYNRRRNRLRGIGLANGARSDRNRPLTPTSISNKKKRRRNKARMTKARDSDANDLGSEEIVDFEEDTVPLRMDVVTGGVSGSEHVVDIPKVSGL
ncbi:hypothetical protein BYT27DRAFT_7197859 [Phlegmacium glaucopus]|nr:hypothetical protein BYT27DRAFT_7197859 [Phlegmacium glaucopus]